MATVNEKMTALADEIRELSGTTTSKSIDAMKSDIDAANAEIAEQAELLAQITTALEGKAGGATLPTLDNPAVATDILSGKEAIDGDGNVITGTITTRTSSNLTASGATVIVPAGYYASQATKSVTTATQATPSVSIDANGKITASATQTAGYVSAGTKSGTKQLTTKAATTYTPSTSNQTIASGTYLTGTQTIKGDANLVAGNIKSGTSIFGVTGTYEGSGGSGGGSVETCAVTVTFIDAGMSGQMPSCVVYTTVEGGKIVNRVYYGDDLEWQSLGTGGGTYHATATINCVVGTSVYMADENTVFGSFATSDNITLKDDLVGLWEVFYEAVINSGTTGTITAS